MWNYILRRLLYTPLVVFGVLLITFILFRLIPGNPARIQAGKYASPETIEEIQEAMGLNKPLFLNLEAARDGPWWKLFDSQFFYEHFYKTATFQFGRSQMTEQRVSSLILQGAGPSLKLAIPIFAGIVFSAICLSLAVAFVRGTVWDLAMVTAAVMGISFPFLALILFGQYFLAYELGWFPVRGYAEGWRGVEYLLLPVILGIAGGVGMNLRFYRTFMLDEVNADHIRTAYAKGVGQARVMFIHLLKNAMIPILTMVILAIPFLFLGNLLLEQFFSIPGLGSLMIESINRRDYAVINGLTYIISLFFVLGQLLTDIAYTLVDPRIALR